MQSRTAPKLSPLSRPPSSADTGQASTRGAASRDPLAIYIHWPFCESKCPYCDFNSYAKRSLSEEAYLTAAMAELRHYAGEARERTATSIFFGGGTPSLMAPKTVASLLDAIAGLWPVDHACEITLEANPSSVEAGRFAGYRAAGVNRVSLGVQSLNDEQLRFLGRLHSAAEARHALEIAARHFERVSFDLIYARPRQTQAEWHAELKEALELVRGHLSLYQLTIEPGTAFFDLHQRGKLRIPHAELAADLYELTLEICEAADLPAYEVSNHAVPGQESRHNLTYWRYGDYLGIGPGAHGRFSFGPAKIATAAIRAPAEWYTQVQALGHGCAERFDLSPHEQAEEMVLMSLRLSEGLDLERLKAQTGYTLALNGAAASLEEDGLLIRDGSRIRVTAAGRLVLNAITAELAAALKRLATM
jgi:oxygen-independent coproporphyrinogen-3 oxidase